MPLAPTASTIISADLLARIVAEAAAVPDREICGLLFGSHDHIEQATAAANVATEPDRRFELDPAVLFRAHKAERNGGPALIGHYHSHPSGSAEPSACDLAAAQPGKLWLILGGRDTRLWLAGVNGFAERSLRIDG